MQKITQEIIHLRLAEAINTSGMSKTEISKRLGISDSMISRYCNTKSFPALDTFANLCKILDVSANYILGLEQ